MEAESYLPITIVPSKTFQDHPNTLFCSSSLLHYWGITNAQHIQLCIGSKLLEVQVKEKALEKDDIYCSQELFAKIPLPKKTIRLLSQFFNKQKTLYLGPIFAIVTEVHEQKNQEINFRSIHSFCEELHYISQLTGGFFYVFPLQNFSMDGIDGYYYDEGAWKKTSFVPPNIIHNRIHSRKLEQHPFSRKIINTISLNHIPFFNERFFSKWETHNILAKEEFLLPHLPETKQLTKESFRELLDVYPTIFLKPTHGSQGRNIFRVNKENKELIIHSSQKGENYLVIQSEEELSNWIKRLQKQRTYIIQQGLPLITFQERTLDFRILCHKTHQDNWRVTSMIARASVKQEFVSNLARGGEMIKPLIPLSKHFDQKTALAIIAFIKELALEVANVISHSATGLIGELGIDIGIDEKGRVWIIEVNSKPSKNAEEQKAKIRPSARSIYEYGTALAFENSKKFFK